MPPHVGPFQLPAVAPFNPAQAIMNFLTQQQPQQTPVPMPAPLEMPATGTSFTLGQYPQLQAPTPQPAPTQMNLEPYRQLLNGMSNVPEAIQLDAPPARAKPKAYDFTPMRAGMESQRPKDHREDARTEKGHDFQDAMAAAARAAAGAQDLGSLLAGAGGAFGGSFSDSRREHKAEDLNFEERQQAFAMHEQQMNFEIGKAETDMANAISEIDHADAMDRWNVANANKQAVNARWDKVQDLEFKKVSAGLDLERLGAEQANSAAEVKYRNAEAARQDANAKLLLQVPQFSLTDEGMAVHKIGPDGKMTYEVTPLNALQRLNQLAKNVESLGPIAQSGMKSQFKYETLAKSAPQYLRQQVIMDILSHPKGEKVFEPGDVGSSGIFSSGKAESIADWFDVGKTMTDQFSTSPYEKAIEEASKFVDAAVTAGRIQPADQQAALIEATAKALESSLTPEVIERARRLNDPTVNTGLAYLSKAGGR